ncbi:MAG: flagellar biosynthesis protein FlhB [Tissierellaceae bacterium]|nr:flagellar biosynthesis protein FlhB [Tissierellaceae bacterium]
MGDKDNKTEEATPKRLSDARKKGQIAKSQDFNSAVSFFVFVMLTGLLGEYLLINSLKFMKNSFSLSLDSSMELSHANVGSLLMNNIIQFAILVFPFMAIALIVGLLVNIIQTGFLYTKEPLKPDFSKLNPIQGFKNIVSVKSIFNLVKNLLKLILVFYITYKNLSESAKQILNSGNIGTEKLYFFLMDFVKELGMDIAVIMIGLGILDYVMQKRDFKKNLRMSNQEIKDEYKEMEGNPQIKSQRQQKQRQMAMSRMMADIPESTVVVTNPTHIAVVLRYDSEKDMAPVVTAKGADYLAGKIKEKAREHHIPIIENKPLARTMYKEVEIGESIPTELYKAIAEILALIYEMNEKKKHKI